MNRRKFLERAGTGTLALGSVPLLAGKAWGGQSGQDRGFRFVVDSFGPGTDRLLFSGDGHFDLDGHVEGGGNFDHFQAMMGTPAPLVSTGTWKASQFVSFTPPTVTATPMGTHGVYQAGILKLKADFYPIGKQKIMDVLLEIVCNLGPAGASTPGKDEGVYLTFEGVAFEPKGIGITLFTRGEHDD